MDENLALSISTGLLCGIWALISGEMGLLTWAGFASCTTYFVAGVKGFEGVKKTIIHNMFGVLCAYVSIQLTAVLNFPGSAYLMSGIFTFIMCIVGRFEILSLIPATFVGSFSTFAADGNLIAVVVPLLLGALLGVACDKGGVWLYEVTNKDKQTSKVE